MSNKDDAAERLINIKRKLKLNSENALKLTGRREELLDKLRRDFKVKDKKGIAKELKRLNSELKNIKSKLNSGLDALEERYGLWMTMDDD